MENEETELDNIVVFQDEDGEDCPFEYLDEIEYEGAEYVVLLPVADEDDEDAGEIVILEHIVTEEDDEELETYGPVEDEEVLNVVFAIFKEKFKDDFDFVE